MGVVNLCNAFIPSMIAHGEDGVVINTGSKQGITRPPGNYAYNLSKASVVAYTEALSHAFITTENCKIKSHLLIPAFVSPMISAFIPEKPTLLRRRKKLLTILWRHSNEMNSIFFVPIMKQIERWMKKGFTGQWMTSSKIDQQCHDGILIIRKSLRLL